MWTDADLDRWITCLRSAHGLGYVQARTILLELRNEIGEATVTLARKDKRARYLAKKAARRAARATNALDPNVQPQER